jgi:hypothetical protein
MKMSFFSSSLIMFARRVHGRLSSMHLGDILCVRVFFGGSCLQRWLYWDFFFFGARDFFLVCVVFFGRMGIYKGSWKSKLERGSRRRMSGQLPRSISGRFTSPMFERLPSSLVSDRIVDEKTMNKLRRTCKANQNLVVEGRPFELR